MRPRTNFNGGCRASGKSHARRGGGRDDHHHLDGPCLNRPRALGQTIGGHVPDAGRGESTAWLWTDCQVTISWSSGSETTHSSVQPVGDGTQSIVVERGHVSRIDRTIWKQAIPALPDGGGPHRHGIEPRRTCALHKQVEGSIVLPNAAQGITDQRRPHEASADVVPIATHKLHQPLARMPTLFAVLEQTKLQGERVGGLSVAEDASSRSDVLGIERLAHPCSETQVARFLLRSAKNTRSQSQQFG